MRDRAFQLNLDGQEITQQVAGGGFGQPKFSREAIAEFQVVTNLFDITQGRSLGIQVQAVSRSGTNDLNGSFYGYFRDESLNSEDFIANRVLPYANQQIGGAIGGPIVRDKLHYFLSYERENEPNTILSSPAALPGFNWSFDTKLVQNSFLGRGRLADAPGRPLHVAVVGTGTGATRSRRWPAPSIRRRPPTARARRSTSRTPGPTCISDTAIQEVRVSYSHFDWKNLLAESALANTPNYVFPTITIGQRRNYPQEFYQNTWALRYDLTTNVGAHDLKVGAEYLRWHDTGQWQLLSRGEFIFNSTPADLARRFPQDAWNDPTRWDLTGLDSTVGRFDQNFGDWTIDIPRPSIALWIGDTWKINNSLTINGGLRWDADFGALDPPHITTTVTFDPRPGYVANSNLQPGDRLYPGDLRDIDNIAPRGGFTWNVGGNGTFVVRGGSGLYYSIPDSNTTFSHQSFNGERILVNSFPNDDQPGFIANPTRGVTADDILSGRVPLPAQSPRVIASDYQMPHTWQSSVGFQTQFGPRWGLDADLTHWKGYNFARQRDPNLAYNPANGYNLAPTAANRPDPKFGQIQWLESTGKADYLALQSGVTKRYSSNWQSALTYAYMFYFNDNTTNFQYQGTNPFDPDAEWARSTEFQRHTLRLNALWRGPWGINLSGAYFFGSGNYYATTVGTTPFGPVAPGNNRFASVPIVVPEAAARSLRRSGHVRRRRHGAAQRAQGRSAAPRRWPAGQGLRPAGRHPDHADRRGLQPLQPQELRGLPERAEQRRVRRSAAEPAERLPAARLPAGLQVHLLDPAERQDSRARPSTAGPFVCTRGSCRRLRARVGYDRDLESPPERSASDRADRRHCDRAPWPRTRGEPSALAAAAAREVIVQPSGNLYLVLPAARTLPMLHAGAEASATRRTATRTNTLRPACDERTSCRSR